MIKNEFRVDKRPYTDIIEKLADSLSVEFYDLVEKELSIFKELLSNIKPLLANNQLDSSEALQIFNHFNSQLGEFLTSSFPSADELEIKEIFKEYTKELEGMIAGMPKKVDYVQRETCFTPIEGDSFRIILLKRCKAIIRKVQSFFRNIANVFRKEKKGQPVWEHTVAIRQIFRYSMRNVFLAELLPSFRETLSKNNEVHFSLLEIGDQLSHWFFIERANSDSELNTEEMLQGFTSIYNKAIADVKEARKRLKVEIKDSGMRALEKYEHLERISGTIEYPDRKSNARSINRSYTELNKQLTEVVHAYGNTSFYLFDDKRFDVSIDRLSTTLLAEQSKVNILLEKKYFSDLISFTTAYAKLLAETESFVAAKGTSLSVLRGIHKEFKSGFASLLIKSLSALKSGAIPVRIRSISRVLLNEVSTFPETKPFIKKFNPSTWTADKELNSIRPADILRFEILPEIEKALTDLASEAQLKLDLLFNHMTEIGTIADFSIESTIKQIREKHEGEHNPIDTLMNGLARSGEKISVILKVFDELKEQVEEELATITKEQVLEIQDLRENERLLSLNMRLASALIKKRAQERWQLFGKKFRKIVEIVLVGPVELVKASVLQIKSSYNRFVHTAVPLAISGELSAFLSESKNARARLPYIYQRLYLVEPLTDDLFYYSRDAEIMQLDNVIAYWENKHYSPPEFRTGTPKLEFK